MESLYHALGALHVEGCEIDFRQMFPEGGQVVSLPTYPWQRQRHWLKPALVPARGQAHVSTAAEVQSADGEVKLSPTAPPQGAGSWMTQLAALPPEAWLAQIEAAVKADAAAVLLLPVADEIHGDRALRELGMDSLMAVQLRHELAARTGLPLPATLVFDYPTVQEITQYLHAALTSATPEAASGPPVSAAQEQ
jgi:acyl transferase domain-containing protein